MDIDFTRLEQLARQASESAYAPYSHFAVGAAVQTRDGEFFSGSNIENASYGLTICAERVATFTAVASGAREIVALAIYTPTPQPVPPCGACRQVLCEFAEELSISAHCLTGARAEWRLSELLPEAFRLNEPPSASE